MMDIQLNFVGEEYKGEKGSTWYLIGIGIKYGGGSAIILFGISCV